MGYKEKYEEALERAKAGKPMDEVFPELKESEGERIRKELISFVNKYYGEETKKEVLAYLEKQKEQKPTNSEKPKEWSEEDDAFRELLICILKVEHPNGIFSMSAKHKSALKYDVMPVNRIIDWLESLRPQPKREWGGEDEKMLDSIIRIITQFDGLAHEPTYAGPKFTHPYTKEIDWLKSLRPQPHWKPSEEQMEALLELEKTYVFEHERTQETAHLYMVIKSLREQLLKLRRGEL